MPELIAGKNAWQSEDYHGKIIVKLQGGKNRTEIPYFLTVLKGGLSYDKMSTTYFLNEKEMDTNERNFEVFNRFYLPVQIVDVKFPFDMDTTFKVTAANRKIIKYLNQIDDVLGSDIDSSNSAPTREEKSV